VARGAVFIPRPSGEYHHTAPAGPAKPQPVSMPFYSVKKAQILQIFQSAGKTGGKFPFRPMRLKGNYWITIYFDPQPLKSPFTSGL
jgi:hypothetical protein